MHFLQVNGSHQDFLQLCNELQNFQFSLMPVLKDKGYSLTENLEEIIGFILYDNKNPIGSIGLKKISEENCEIVRVYLQEDYRGKGYSKLLFEKIEALAKKLKFKKAEMVAWSKATHAIGLYKKLGYNYSEEKDSEWFTGLKYIEFSKTL